MSNKDMLIKYYDMMESIDYDSAESLKELSEDSTNNVNNATVASWTKSAIGYATQNDNSQNDNSIKDSKTTVLKLKLMHDQALEKTEFDDVSKEISSLYDCVLEFKKAEMNIEDIANISKGRIEKDSMNKIESNLDNVYSSLKTAITRSFGMLSNPVKSLKNYLNDVLKPQLKEMIKDFSSELKEKFVNMLSKVVKLYFQIFNEFVSKVFSFVDMIKGIAKSKGFGIKSVTVSFEPPGFDKIDIFGFTLPIPIVSLPKVDINFEIEMRLENGSNNITNNSIINKESNGVEISTNSYEYSKDIKKIEINNIRNIPYIESNIDEQALKLLLDGRIEEFNDIRKKGDFTQLSLLNAKLSNADLIGANLSKANLSKANLSKANLFGANLSDADLTSANLFRANLSNANYSNANLSKANLFGANLSKANLFGANLTSTNLSNAILINTNYENLQINIYTNFTDAITDNSNFIDYLLQFTSKVPNKIENKKELMIKLEERKLPQHYIDHLLNSSKLSE